MVLSVLSLVSCKNEAEKRVEIAKIVESRSAKGLLDDLYIGSDGDVEAVARMLSATPSSLERIRTGETVPTEAFEKRIRDVCIFYALNGQSFSKLRKAIDPAWGRYNTVLYAPVHHWVWSIIILVVSLILIFAAVMMGHDGAWQMGCFPLAITALVLLVAFLWGLAFGPEAMEDEYVGSINPMIERIQ